MDKSIHVIILFVIVLASVFLIWDGLSNNGNMFWNLMFATVEYGGISDEIWEQQYGKHVIVLAFMQKYPDAINSQELDFGFKRLFYTYQNGTDVLELSITKGPHDREHFQLHCETETRFNSILIINSMQLDGFQCMGNEN